jgi:translation elongation factor EF-1alpha
MGEEQEVGKVVGYFGKIGVAAVEATSEFAVGDTLHFKGHTTDFTSKVESMQIEGEQVEKVSPGDQVGIKVPEKTRDGDKVYRATEA